MKNCSLYIHIPFCEQKCFYCSFVVSVGQKHRMQDYCDALIMEMKQFRGREIKTIYLGGGTPSLLAYEQLQKIFGGIHEYFIVSPDAEISLEANPKDLDEAKIKNIKRCGVNRISVGAQTFNDDFLKYLGRIHEAHNIYQTIEIIQSAGIKNISMDLMFGFPAQTSFQIEKDIEKIFSLKPQHVSLYALTIEQNSRFYVKNVRLHDDEMQSEHYNLVLKSMKDGGFNQYEVSNFARPGYESKHNLNYWEGGDYIGLGVGAHSYVDGKRFWNISKLQEYVTRINRGESVEEGCQVLDCDMQMMDRLLFGLRMNKGVDLEKIQQEYQSVFQDQIKQTLADFQAGGFIERKNTFYKVTEKGRLVLDELCARLV